MNAPDFSRFVLLFINQMFWSAAAHVLPRHIHGYTAAGDLVFGSCRQKVMRVIGSCHSRAVADYMHCILVLSI